MNLHDPEVDRIREAQERARERADAARVRLADIMAGYERQVADSLARHLTQAERPVCPCCHRPMTDPPERSQP